MVEARSSYVVDASIALKWLLPVSEEPHAHLALDVLRDAREGRTRLVAPSHIYYEVGSALVRAVRNLDRLMTFDQGERSLRVFHSFDSFLLPYDERQMQMSAWRLAHQYGCSYYDATYLATAEQFGWPVIHADDALRRKLAGLFPYELWIEDYRSP